jgi:hypothetical protein
MVAGVERVENTGLLLSQRKNGFFCFPHIKCNKLKTPKDFADRITF